MKHFYKEYKNRPQLVANLPWGYNVLLMERFKDITIRETYAKAIIENGWSRNMLSMHINID